MLKQGSRPSLPSGVPSFAYSFSTEQLLSPEITGPDDAAVGAMIESLVKKRDSLNPAKLRATMSNYAAISCRHSAQLQDVAERIHEQKPQVHRSGVMPSAAAVKQSRSRAEAVVPLTRRLRELERAALILDGDLAIACAEWGAVLAINAAIAELRAMQPLPAKVAPKAKRGLFSRKKPTTKPEVPVETAPSLAFGGGS